MNELPKNTHRIDSFLLEHQLTPDYITLAQQWFDPLANILAAKTSHNKPFIVGINGCQGSGKSTLAAYLCAVLTERFNLKAISLSLDDFYLDIASRKQLSDRVHSLLSTRGVPGTHDVALALTTFTALKKSSGCTTVPVFNKAADNRSSHHRQVNLPLDIIIFEGWCLGAQAQNISALTAPINSLEETQDANGVWRSYVNSQLTHDYAKLFKLIDYWVMLKAPSFDCVYQWRLEQEIKLSKKQSLKNGGDHQLKSKLRIMNASEVTDFVQHYQRITEQLLKTFSNKADCVYELDERRTVTRSVRNNHPN